MELVQWVRLQLVRIRQKSISRELESDRKPHNDISSPAWKYSESLLYIYFSGGYSFEFFRTNCSCLRAGGVECASRWDAM